MSTTVDERVVSMKFDNAQFERETRTTMSTLDKLKEKLNFSKSADGLDEVNKAAKRADFSPMENAADAVRVKFSYLQASVQNVLNNIVNSAVNAGKNIISALTIDPIKTGLQEYETKIDAIQVIKANTMGKNTMEEITKALGELNEYADKTIYNFAQMTSNVGKFVAQGLDVKQATNAIQGMANLAAASGASAEDMSRATYQMSQALGGTIRKMDWNSLRNANMATTTLKETLMDLARVEGIDIDKMIKNKGIFEDTLEEGWLTGELFTKAMNIYSGVYSEAELKAQGFNDEQIKKFQDIAAMAESAATEVKKVSQLWDVLKETAQSGWTQTWEYVIGDFETAKADLSKAQTFLSGMLNKMADKRNELFKGWNEAGGRDLLIDSVVNVAKAIESVVAPIREAFRDIFPEMEVEQLLNLTKGIKEFTANLKLSDKASANLKSTFRGLFAAVDIVWKIFKAVLTALKPIVGLFGDITGGVLGATGSFGEWIVALNDFIDKSGILTNVAEGIAFVFQKMLDFAKKYLTPFIEGIQNGLSRLVGGASAMKDGVVGAVDSMGTALENSSFFKVLSGLWKIIYSVGSAITKVLGSAVGGLIDALAGSDFSKIFDFFNTLSLSAITVFIAKFVKGFGDTIEIVADFKESLVSILDAAKGCLEAWQSSIKANALLKIAAAVGILAVSLLLLAGIDSVKLAASLAAISALFGELMLSMSIFNKLNLTKDTAKSTLALIGFSTAIFLLASALRMAAGADIDNMVVAGGAIVGLMYAMTHVAELLSSRIEQAEVITNVWAMIGFAAAIYVLARALRVVADADIPNMIYALSSIAVLMALMVSVVESLERSPDEQLTMASYEMMGFAAAIFILASALRMVAELDIAQLDIGILGIAALMGGMIVVAKVLSKNKADLLGVGGGLILFAVAVDLLVIGVKELAKLDLASLAKGVGAVLLLMGVMIGFAAVVKNASGTIAWAGVAMIPMATAMIILAAAVKIFGAMELPALGKGLVALAGGLTAITVVCRVLAKDAKNALIASGVMAAFAGALLVLAGTLVIFEHLSWSSLGKAGAVLLALLATFAAFAIASAFPVALAAMEAACVIIMQLGLVMLEVGAGVFMFGAGLALAAASMVIFGIGLSAIAVGMEALAKAIPAYTRSIFETLNIIIDGFANFGPNAAASLAKGISTICQAIMLSASSIALAISSVIAELGVALIDIIPGLVEVLYEIIKQSLEVLVDYIPELTELLVDFFVSLFDSLAIKAPEFYDSLSNFLMTMFGTLIDVFNDINFEIILNGMGSLYMFTLILTALAAISVQVLPALATLSAVVLALTGVIMGFGLLYNLPFVQDLLYDGGQFLEDLGYALGSFVGGIVGGVAQASTDGLEEVGHDLSDFMVALQPFIEGVQSIDATTLSSIESLAKAVLTITAANIMDSLTSWFTGGNSLVQFGMELAAFGPFFRSYYESVKGIDGDVIEASANAAKALSEMATNLPNSGGLVSWVTGDNTLAKFAAELVLFGPSLKAYANSVSGLDTNVVINSVNAAKAISEMATNLPNSGGLVSWVTGDNTLARFATELALFGPSLKTYANSVAGMNSDVVLNSVNAAKTIAEFAAIIPNMGGLKSLWEGDNTLAAFGEQLVIFGPFMKSYSNSVTGLKTEPVKVSAESAKILADMAHNVSANKTSGLLSFGTSLATFGQNFKKYIDNLKGVSADKIRSTNEALKEIMNIANLVSESSASGLSSMGEALSKFAASSIDDFVNAFTSAKPKVVDAATGLVTSFGDGVKSASNKIVSAFDSIFVDILTAANGQYDDFYTAGGYVVEGFATGISEKTWMAEAKAEAMARAALAAAKAALDEHSPSREFYKVGAFAGAGFVNAFSDYEATSYRAGSGIAEAARKGLSNAVSKINRFISSDLDTQPTIRPVLDLSDLKSGANAIGGMIGVGSSIGILNNVGSINSMMNRRNQNGVNADVVTAINKLRGDLENISKPSYNINGITYDSGTEVADAIETLIRATTIEGRI